MWSRKTTDPLGTLLFTKYGMHVLSRPRADVSVLNVFGLRDGEAFQSGDVDTFLHAKLAKPEVAKGEAVLDIDATVSDAVSGKAGLGFLQGFLALLGVGVAKSVSAAVEKSKSQALRFQFGGCTRDYVKDGFQLDWTLSEHPFDKGKSGMKEGARYYIATAVHHCTKLTFEVLDKNMGKLDFSADVPALATANAGLTISKDRQITASSDKALAYGVELNEIVYDDKRRRLQLQESKNYVHVKAGGGQPLPKAMVGGPDDEMILRIAD